MTPEEKEQILKELGGIPAETYDELIKELMPALKEQVSQIKELCSAKNLQELSEVAHSVKGSAGNFRLREVHEIAAEVEKMAKESASDDSLQNEIQKLEEAVLNFEKDFN